MEPIGQASVQVIVGDWMALHNFVVVQFDTCPTLGSDFLLDHGVILDLGRKRIEWMGGIAQLTTPLRKPKVSVVLDEDLEGAGARIITRARVVCEGYLGLG